MAARPGVDQVEHFTLHDLRRTAATGMQRLGVALPVVEAVLNHVSGSRAGVAGVYQRHHYTDEKRHALNAWAAEIERIVAGRKRGNVVPLKGRAK
jgi:integrase